MQDASAYYNNTYTGEAGVQGLCPAGWHVPTGGASGEYQSLANAVQGSAVSDGCTSSDCATAYNFFRTASSNAWNATTKSMIAGAASSGSLNTQGTSSNWWSSTVDSTTDAYSLGLNASGIYPQNILDKYYGFSVRCVQTPSCGTNQTWSDTYHTCVGTCASGYEWSVTAGTCVKPCSSGYTYSLELDQCIVDCDEHASRGSDGVSCVCASGYAAASTGAASYTTADTCAPIDSNTDLTENFDYTYLQDFTTVACESFPTPTGTNYVDVGTLIDRRDNKEYAVRKYADGNCWLAQNLQYGTTVDYSTYITNHKISNRNVIGEGLYGIATPAGDNYDGYLYNWQAAVQHASSYYNNDYQPDEPVQGLCPAGWHLPSGGTQNSEWHLLANAVNGSATSNGCQREVCGTAHDFFGTNGSNAWNATSKSTFAGNTAEDGSSTIWGQGSNADWWSSHQYSVEKAGRLYIGPNIINAYDNNNKYYGCSIRCVKNTRTCPSGLTWDATAGDCVHNCGDGAVYSDTYATCVPVCPEGQSYNATTGECGCANGGTYNESQGACLVAQGCAVTAVTGSLQSFDCNSLTKPGSTGTSYSETCRYDERDGKTYTVRRFADGKCWLANNLAFGSNCTATSFSGSDTASATGYVGTYDGYAYKGLCRSPGDAYDGYLYNWEATMNNSTAVYNGTFDNRTNGTTLATHDICPLGWHVPTGGSGGEFQVLADKIQGSSVSNGCASGTCGTAWSFFRTAGANGWNATTKSMIAGNAGSGSLYNQGTNSYWWSSTVYSTTGAYSLYLNASYIYPQGYNNKYHGFSVRCVQTPTCPAGTTWSDSDGACVDASGYDASATYDGVYMQDFTTAQCDALPTPTGADYVTVGTLLDRRDNKAYVIRKFADGKCWMAQNLAHGTPVDAETYAQYASTTTGDAHPLGSGLYGVARQVDGYADYLYNWQAAVQSPDAYHGSSYQPTEPTQGICPSGWHVPVGTHDLIYTGELSELSDAINGGHMSNVALGGSTVLNFFETAWWADGYIRNYPGYIAADGTPTRTGWYSTRTSSHRMTSSTESNVFGVMPQSQTHINNTHPSTYGNPVRCVKNTAATCPDGYAWSDALSQCALVCDAHATQAGASTCACADGYRTAAGLGSYTAPGDSCRKFDHYNASGLYSGLNMQDFTAAMCDYLATPTGTGYVDVGNLTDTRDNTVYAVRKYADGRCWLAENLKFGSNCTYTGFSSSDVDTMSGYVGTYGGVVYHGACYTASEGYDGYYYNWEAAMNNSTAIYNGDYVAHNTASDTGNGVTLATHDICPLGWHVPSGGSGGEFQVLSNYIQYGNNNSNVANPCDPETCRQLQLL